VLDDLSLLCLRQIEPDGWRLWHLHHHTGGFWEARLYRTERVDAGKGEEWLSPQGRGPTPEAAVLACLNRLVEGEIGRASVEGVLRLEAALARLEAAVGRLAAHLSDD
jgi:hypothetical protein